MSDSHTTHAAAPRAPRILFVDHVGVLGGAELSLLDLAARCPWPCRVLLFQDGPLEARLQAAAVPVGVVRASRRMQSVSRGGGLLADVLSIPSLLGVAFRVAVAARQHDVLYANSQKAFVVAALAGALARRPVVWHLRDVLSDEHFSRWHRRLVASLSNVCARLVIANSAATANALVDSGGRRSKVRTIYNGIDAEAFHTVSAAAVRALRRELRIDGVPTVGVFSRLARWKGQHVLLDAIAELPGVHALIVGEPLFGEAEYAAFLSDRAAHLGIAARVRFLGYRPDVAALMQACDVIVHTSIAPEPFGRVVVEGMYAGRPVVAAAAGGVIEILEDRRTGILVPPGDARGLREALAGLLACPRAARRMGARARTAARRRFSVDRMVSGVRDAVLEMLTTAPQSRVAAGVPTHPGAES